MSVGLAKKFVATVAMIAAMTLLSVVTTPQTVRAETYSCQNSTCTSAASCSGTTFTHNGCTIQCYVPGDEPDEIVTAGSATCTSAGGGGGGGGGWDPGGDWWCGEFCWE